MVAEARLVPRGSGVSKISASTETEEMENGKRLSTPSVIHTECAKILMASQESDQLGKKIVEKCLIWGQYNIKRIIILYMDFCPQRI